MGREARINKAKREREAIAYLESDEGKAELAEHERKEFIDYAGGSPLHAPLAYAYFYWKHWLFRPRAAFYHRGPVHLGRR